jgi:hypothetical protein
MFVIFFCATFNITTPSSFSHYNRLQFKVATVLNWLCALAASIVTSRLRPCLHTCQNIRLCKWFLPKHGTQRQERCQQPFAFRGLLTQTWYAKAGVMPTIFCFSKATCPGIGLRGRGDAITTFIRDGQVRPRTDTQTSRQPASSFRTHSLRRLLKQLIRFNIAIKIFSISI